MAWRRDSMWRWRWPARLPLARSARARRIRSKWRFALPHPSSDRGHPGAALRRHRGSGGRGFAARCARGGGWCRSGLSRSAQQLATGCSRWFSFAPMACLAGRPSVVRLPGEREERYLEHLRGQTGRKSSLPPATSSPNCRRSCSISRESEKRGGCA